MSSDPVTQVSKGRLHAPSPLLLVIMTVCIVTAFANGHHELGDIAMTSALAIPTGAFIQEVWRVFAN
jgi:hypothetical protein